MCSFSAFFVATKSVLLDSALLHIVAVEMLNVAHIHSPREIISMAGKTGHDGTTQDGSGNKAENYSYILATNQHHLRQKMCQ